ncbi:glycosyltransferase family 8 protein [Vibrio sp. M260118]|uniref:glycosyltransferase family 8 protein n=1 Tax=Vibrio sp. M260118 TaxID=3020896 RepID=UPI002F3E3DC7
MNDINLAFTFKDNYAAHFSVSLRSLLDFNRDSKFNIYILSSHLKTRTKDKINSTFGKYDNIKINYINIDRNLFEGFKLGYHFVPEVYYRVLMADVIKQDKVLYLDCDVIVQGSIREMYNLSPLSILAVKDYGKYKYSERLGIADSERYFNAGIMLVNLAYWRNHGISKRLLEFISINPEKIEFADQCALNKIFHTTWEELDVKYNFTTAHSRDREYDKVEPIVIHFTGSTKPWDFRSTSKYKRLYYNTLKKTRFFYYGNFFDRIKNIVSYLTS